MLHPPPSGRDPLYDPPLPPGTGTKDGNRAADHDEPYVPRQPHMRWPYPFTLVQYGRLLVLRGRVRDGLFGADDLISS